MEIESKRVEIPAVHLEIEAGRMEMQTVRLELEAAQKDGPVYGRPSLVRFCEVSAVAAGPQ